MFVKCLLFLMNCFKSNKLWISVNELYKISWSIENNIRFIFYICVDINLCMNMSMNNM